MKIAYIAGPYRSTSASGIMTNIRNAEKIAIEFWRKGYAVLCPHKNSAFFDGLAPDSVWLEGDLEFIRRLIPGTDVIIMVPGWTESEGAKAERELAMSLGIEILYKGVE